MAQTFKYPNFVDKDNIVIIGGFIPNSPYRWRSALIIPLKNDANNVKKVITFIMKNPSTADKRVIDKTISNVIYYVDRLKKVDERFSAISEIRILNLYSIYSTDSSDLFGILNTIEIGEELKKENDKTIKELLIDTDFIVPAWGKKPSNVRGIDNEYRDRTIEVVNLISHSVLGHKLFLIKYNKKRTLYPIHPERIGYKGEKIKKFLLYPYLIKGNWFVPK